VTRRTRFELRLIGRYPRQVCGRRGAHGGGLLLGKGGIGEAEIDLGRPVAPQLSTEGAASARLSLGKTSTPAGTPWP
jgi:hypothetical protein